MENVNEDFIYIADAVFETQQSDFYIHAMHSPEGEDETYDDEDKSESSNDNDPPLDEDVVHSPLPPQTGGKPR